MCIQVMTKNPRERRELFNSLVDGFMPRLHSIFYVKFFNWRIPRGMSTFRLYLPRICTKVSIISFNPPLVLSKQAARLDLKIVRLLYCPQGNGPCTQQRFPVLIPTPSSYRRPGPFDFLLYHIFDIHFV